MRIRAGIAAVSLLAASGVIVASASTAWATSFTVGNTGDASNSPCNGSNCSLRELILKANQGDFPPTVIHVPAGHYTLNPAFGPLHISDSMTIAGAGANKTVIAMPVPADRATSTDDRRVFDVAAASGGLTPNVTISGVTIAGGTANALTGNFGGDVRNAAYLTLTKDWITNGYACSGGGVANVSGWLTIESSLVSGNGARCGGGDSGGLLNYGAPGSPDLPGHLVVQNSTVTGNDARLIGGLFSWNDTTNTVDVRNSTIANNVSKDEEANTVRGPAGIGIGAGALHIAGSIVSGNVEVSGTTTTSANCEIDSNTTVHSLGYNIDSGTSCVLHAGTDHASTNPRLASLAANGGPTKSLALKPGSPALNRIPARSSLCPHTDQRGIARPQGPACDIGAYERTPAPGTVITSATIRPANHSATFGFRGTGNVAGFQCKLQRRNGPGASYRACTSPKTYKNLTSGSYTFFVRAHGAGGTDPTPATHSFQI